MTYQKVPFPTIDVSKPRGSYRVSTVDDHERETRRWLKQSLQALSGYPEIDTVGIIGWTTGTRPRRSPNGNYLLGYNTSTQSLELIAEDGSIANISRAMCLVAHPVGSIYETTDVSFNPNVEWGGTWELMDDGRFLLSSSEQYAVNAVGGEEEHTLSVPEIPNHRHLHSHPHSHARGTLEHHIVGEFGADDKQTHHLSGAFYGSKSVGVETTSEGGDGDGFAIQFDSTRDGASYWEGHTSQDDTEGGSYVGGGEPHNNMPPYYVVRRWRRIA